MNDDHGNPATSGGACALKTLREEDEEDDLPTYDRSRENAEREEGQSIRRLDDVVAAPAVLFTKLARSDSSPVCVLFSCCVRRHDTVLGSRA